MDAIKKRKINEDVSQKNYEEPPIEPPITFTTQEYENVQSNSYHTEIGTDENNVAKNMLYEMDKELISQIKYFIKENEPVESGNLSRHMIDLYGSSPTQIRSQSGKRVEGMLLILIHKLIDLKEKGIIVEEKIGNQSFYSLGYSKLMFQQLMRQRSNNVLNNAANEFIRTYKGGSKYKKSYRRKIKTSRRKTTRKTTRNSSRKTRKTTRNSSRKTRKTTRNSSRKTRKTTRKSTRKTRKTTRKTRKTTRKSTRKTRKINRKKSKN